MAAAQENASRNIDDIFSDEPIRYMWKYRAVVGKYKTPVMNKPKAEKSAKDLTVYLEKNPKEYPELLKKIYDKTNPDSYQGWLFDYHNLLVRTAAKVQPSVALDFVKNKMKTDPDIQHRHFLASMLDTALETDSSLIDADTYNMAYAFMIDQEALVMDAAMPLLYNLTYTRPDLGKKMVEKSEDMHRHGTCDDVVINFVKNFIEYNHGVYGRIELQKTELAQFIIETALLEATPNDISEEKKEELLDNWRGPHRNAIYGPVVVERAKNAFGKIGMTL